MSQRRYEGACNRIADANVTFCDKGGMTKHMTDFSAKKNRNGAKSIPTWQGQKDLNPRHAVLETAALPTELYP